MARRFPLGNLTALTGALAAAVLLLAGCGGGSGSSSGPDTADDPYEVSIGGAGQGQFNSVIAAAWAQLLNKYDPAVRATAVNTSGINENFQLLATGRATFAFTSGLQYDQANEGDERVVNAEQYKRIMPLFQLPAGQHHWVVNPDSPITSLSDLAGKRIGGFATGSGGWDYVKLTLEAAGVTDYEEVAVGPSQALDQLAQGRIDAVMTLAALPNSNLVQHSATHQFRLLPVTAEVADKVIQKYPSFLKSTIPPGTYTGEVNTTEVPTIEATDVCAAQVDVPAPVVTEAMNALFDHLDEFGAAHPGAKRQIGRAHV